MHNKDIRFSLAMMMLLLFAASTQAQDTTVQTLERNLQERDKVINELLDRIELLEKRTGVQRQRKDSATVPEQDDTPTVNRAPGVVVVEESDAERALERSLTQAGALLLPSGIFEFEPTITYTRQEASAPTLVMSGTGFVAGEIESNANTLTVDLGLRIGLPLDSQLEIGVPYRQRNIETVTKVGFAPIDKSSITGGDWGDVRLGLAKTLLREGLSRPDLIGRLTWDTDTGKTLDDGVSLGGGFHEVRTSLTTIKRQDPVVFVGGISYEHTFEKDQVQPGSTIAANVGSYIALSPETSLRLFFSTAYQNKTEVSGSKIEGSERNIGSFVVGGSTLLAPGTLLNLSLGIGLTDDADDLSISLSLPTR